MPDPKGEQPFMLNTIDKNGLFTDDSEDEDDDDDDENKQLYTYQQNQEKMTIKEALYHNELGSIIWAPEDRCSTCRTEDLGYSTYNGNSI